MVFLASAYDQFSEPLDDEPIVFMTIDRNESEIRVLINPRNCSEAYLVLSRLLVYLIMHVSQLMAEDLLMIT